MLYEIDYQISLDQISDLIFSVDLPGNLLYVNKAVEKVLGYQVEYIIGQNVSKIMTAESWQTVQRFFQSHIRFNREVTAPFSFIKADGDIAILEAKAVPIVQDNKIVAIQGICRDITEKVRLQEQLKQERRQAQVLYEITTILNQPLEPEDMAGSCLDKLCDFLGASMGLIRSFDFRAGRALLIVARGLSDDYINEEKASSIKLIDSPFYTRLSQGNTIIIEDYEKDPVLPRKKLFREGVRSAVFMPIRSRGENLLGFLALLSRDYSYFKPEILPFLEVVTSQMGIATERKRLEKEITEAKQFLTNILERMLDAVIATDAYGIVTFFNPGAKAFTGYETEELLGQPVWKLYLKGKDGAKKIMSILIKEGKLANYELEMLNKDGKVIPIMSSITLLRNDKGEIVGTLGVAKDLTEKKALERAIFQSEKLASVGMLAAGAAHEIFNPMQVILGTSQLLIQKQEWDDSAIAKLKKIEDQVKRVTNIINGLRQFSSPSSQEKTMLDLNATLKEALSLIEYEFPRDGIEIIAKIDPQPLMLYGNKAEFVQLFLNLLFNARDAMPKGGRVTATTALYVSQGRHWARTVISDTGCGISPELLPKIFYPFFTTKDIGKGTGLGLAVCHGIVERHDGLISVESQPEQGTTFTVDLPLST